MMSRTVAGSSLLQKEVLVTDYFDIRTAYCKYISNSDEIPEIGFWFTYSPVHDDVK